jgi:hypothetical protein
MLNVLAQRTPDGYIRLAEDDRYVLTADGVRIAVYYNKVYNRLLIPLTTADQPRHHPSSAPPYRQSPVTSTSTPKGC